MEASFAEPVPKEFLHADAEVLKNIEDLYRNALINLMQRVSAAHTVVSCGPFTVHRPNELPPRVVIAATAKEGTVLERSSPDLEKIPAA